MIDKDVLKLIQTAPKILACVSGGSDSMCLLHLMTAYKEKLTVACINYQTRENSYQEEALVQKVCAEIGVDCFVLRAEACSLDMPNFEEAARKIRYDFFLKIAEEQKIPLILTGQHQDDLTETVLLRLLRGSTFLGMKKIREIKNGILLARPLISVSRKEIMSYNQQNSIPWREDESNNSIYFLRNFLRHNIIPLLQEKVHGLEKRLSLFSKLRIEEEIFLAESAKEALENLGVPPSGHKLKQLPMALRRRVLNLLIENQGEKPPGAREAEETFRKMEKPQGNAVLWQGTNFNLIYKKSFLFFIEK